MSERRDSNSGRPARGTGPRRSGDSRPSSPRSGGGSRGRFDRGDDRGPRGPRRDDDRPSRGRFDRSDDRGSRGRFDRSDDRGSRGRFDRDNDRPSRGPRRDDDRPSRGRFDRDNDRPSRGPRRDDERPSRGRFDRGDDRGSRGPRRDDDRPSRGRFDRDNDRPSRGRFDRSDDRGSRGPRRDDDRPSRGRFNRSDDRGSYREDNRTAAQRRSAEVYERTGGRQTRGGMSNPPERSREDWIDEGSTRPTRRPSGVRAKATGRAQKGGRKEVRALDAVVEEFEKVLGSRASARAIKRYEAALQAFEAHRYDDARKILSPMAREYADVSAVREMFGLCLYRGGQWKRALGELETAVRLNPDWIFNHAVIADCHRALGNHQLVEQYWRELAEASPHPELLAEGRIVMAGSLADRGLFVEAMDLMEKAGGDMKRPSEYHLRQWFVIADLYDRQGNVIKARQFFERIAQHDPQFVDVAERLSTLGY